MAQLLATSVTGSLTVTGVITATTTPVGLVGTASWALTAVNGGTQLVTGSIYPITASNALTASFAVTYSYTTQSISSIASQSYSTITTSSTNWITASFATSNTNVEQYISIPSSSAYNFTCSNVPIGSSVSNLSLFLNNTSTNTSSLSFPSNWIFMGVVPTYITSSKSAILSLKAFGNGQIVAAWGQQY